MHPDCRIRVMKTRSQRYLKRPSNYFGGQGNAICLNINFDNATSDINYVGMRAGCHVIEIPTMYIDRRDCKLLDFTPPVLSFSGAPVQFLQRRPTDQVTKMPAQAM